MDANDVIEREKGLKRVLTPRQLTMIGIGGAIGTGLFMGSGIAIAYAGPGVLVSYVVAAFIALAVMYSLSEMSVAHPTAGSFGTYADLYLHPWAGFLVRYTYWAAQVIAIGGESVAIGHYVQFWSPDMPVWITTLIAGGAIFYINSRSVANFGSAEYWLSTIKVTAIIVFILFGIANIFGIGTEATGFSNYFVEGGPFPHGFGGIWFAVLMAIFSFMGIEVIAVTAGEAENPDVSLPKAMRSMLLRLSLFYFLALGIILAITPWTESGAIVVSESPFVKVFSNFGFAAAATVMNFVIMSAAFSSMNTNLYLCSRMIFSLSRAGKAPAAFGRIGARGTPWLATLMSIGGVAVASAIAYASSKAYNYLLGIAMFGAVVTWITILATHLVFRRRYPAIKQAALSVRAPLAPYLQWIALALLVAVLVTMGFDTEFWNIAVIVGVPWVIMLSVAYAVMRRRQRAPAAT
ncbi:MAG TPA: amino acid permease [Woeseiaceae bacterium]|nr:amino acid permease [Woeseiaceae bacterium]